MSESDATPHLNGSVTAAEECELLEQLFQRAPLLRPVGLILLRSNLLGPGGKTVKRWGLADLSGQPTAIPLLDIQSAMMIVGHLTSFLTSAGIITTMALHSPEGEDASKAVVQVEARLHPKAIANEKPTQTGGGDSPNILMCRAPNPLSGLRIITEACLSTWPVTSAPLCEKPPAAALVAPPPTRLVGGDQ